MIFADDDDAVGIYISLLIGDLQIQRVIGVRSALKPDEIKVRAARAYRLVLDLFGTETDP